MKKLCILFIALLFIPVFCSAGVTLNGVNCGSVEAAYVKKFLEVGDSIAVGNGSHWPDVDSGSGTGPPPAGTWNIGGDRPYLQDLIGGKMSFVGQWGNIDGENPGPTPELDTKADDENYLLPAEYSPRHFGMSGKPIHDMVEAFTRLNQLDWFSATSTGDIIKIMLGTNNRASIDGPDPKEPDTSAIESEVTELLSLVATIHAKNPNIEIIFCLITPQLADPSEVNVAWQNEWVLAFNTELISQFTAMPANPHIYLVLDTYSALAQNEDWYDGTYSGPGDRLHPNNGGYEKIAEILYDKMIEEGLL